MTIAEIIKFCTHDCKWQKKDQVGEKLQADHHHHFPKGFFPHFSMSFQGEALIWVPVTVVLDKNKYLQGQHILITTVHIEAY